MVPESWVVIIVTQAAAGRLSRCVWRERGEVVSHSGETHSKKMDEAAAAEKRRRKKEKKRLRLLESGPAGAPTEEDPVRDKQQRVADGTSKKRHRADFEEAVSAAPAAPEVEIPEEYSWPTDEGDHCETPLEAYAHIAPLLHVLCARLGKAPSALRIYDPYFCEGRMAEHLLSLGFSNVYNKRQDFYGAIAQGTTPAFDVLVTNPPYSADNIPRLLQFCEQQREPWMLLLPNWVYTKPYYAPLLQRPPPPALRFYLAPKRRYLYTTPKSRRQLKSAKYTSPFASFWFCSLPALPSPPPTQPEAGAVPSANSSKGPLPAAIQAAAHADCHLSLHTPSGLPLIHLDERDDAKKRERNNKKRKKNKDRRKAKG